MNDSRDELFAAQLKAARPALSDAAMKRVAAAMRREMAQPQRRRFAFPAIAAGIAAGVLLALMALPLTYFSSPRATDLRAENARSKERERLLAMFNSEPNFSKKLELLPQLERISTDAQLPDEVRYYMALDKLRPHLEWHASYAPNMEKLRSRSAPDEEGDWRWSEAHPGEDWMVPDEARARIDAEHQKTLLKIADAQPRYWRVTNPCHPSVARAEALLTGITAEGFAKKSSRWVEELRRNNTVITFDVPGGVASGSAATLVMDIRAADRVAFKLYRIRKPDELLAAAGRAGVDFVFTTQPGVQEELEKAMAQQAISELLRVHDAGPLPEFEGGELVESWSADVKALKAVARKSSWEDYWDEEEELSDEEAYFGDDCSGYRDRLDRKYVNDAGATSWQCGRVVEIPAAALAKPGGYVLVAEANGAKACAPVLVDPLSLVLRRCRDGVFALVSSSDGEQPVAGARVLAREQAGEALTDARGAAFAKVFASGDRAIVAEKDGRFAIGGFGRIFDGIYFINRGRYGWYGELRQAIYDRVVDPVANVYTDRHILAAYTDRPVYRPGQELNFKLIARQMLPETAKAADGDFRAGDFELSRNLVIPPETRAAYELIDPKGRTVATGTLALNDYGTAAGSAKLSTEAVHGRYSLRVNIGGAQRIVPEIFAVQHYRRPNFELSISGLPEKAPVNTETIKLQVSGNYYFGKPVEKGTVTARIVRANGTLVVEEAVELNADVGKLELWLPEGLAPGKYFCVCELTDDSGRSVRETKMFEFGNVASATGIAALPKFCRVGEKIRIATTAAEVTSGTQKFRPVNGVAEITLETIGWHAIKSGDERTEIFVYGGRKAPRLFDGAEPDVAPASDWENLTDFAIEDDYDYERHESARPAEQLFALFDRKDVTVGGTLRVLVFVPQRQARLLFTMEGRTIVDYFTAGVTDAAGYYHVVEIPIRERHLPNFYLQGRILASSSSDNANVPDQQAKMEKAMKDVAFEDGEDPQWCRVEVAPAPGSTVGDELKLSIETDRTEYKPGDTVEASIRILDAEGKPSPAEVSLCAVDESLYVFGEDRSTRLGEFFRSARPERRYYRKSWRSSLGGQWSGRVKDQLAQLSKAMKQLKQAEMQQALSSADMQSALDAAGKFLERPQSLSSLGGMLPASSIPLPAVRSDFRETAAWQPQLRAGADGTIRARFKLPDSLTRYRLTAVGLTKQTQTGSAVSTVRAALPLSVQNFLPRFAVESDRLMAVGLVHNTTAVAKHVQLEWEVDGAAIDGSGAELDGFAFDTINGRTVARGRISVPAGGSARAGVWLKLARSGDVRVLLRGSDGGDADAEERVMPVYILGRPAEVAFNARAEKLEHPELTSTFSGTFTRSTRVKLPKGFTADDLRISLSCSGAAQALDGLGYLVEYPYGCVEQTMSRFLPAVMVKHAAQQLPIPLPPDVSKKLPDVLQKGLERLYKFQHDDGGWGWWEKDQTNQGMTLYVVYGLARCRATGTPVDAEVLRRGCDYVRLLVAGKSLSLDDEARARHALALAGEAAVEEAAAFEGSAAHSGAASCDAVLALQQFGRKPADDKLAARINAWTVKSAQEQALKLRAQMALGADAELAAGTEQLLSMRSGTRWYNTRDTSAAIEALSEMLARLPARQETRRVEAAVGGKTVLRVADPVELAKLAYRVHLVGKEVPTGDELEIVLAADCDQPLRYAISAVGSQRMDVLPPSGSAVKLLRRLETLDGNPLAAPLKAGDTVAVRLTLELTERREYLIVEDRRPAGCEFADDRLTGAVKAANVEFRDDRICAFFGQLPAGKHEFVYYLKAETPGTSHVLPGCAYPMYDEKLRGETGSSVMEILPPAERGF